MRKEDQQEKQSHLIRPVKIFIALWRITILLKDWGWPLRSFVNYGQHSLGVIQFRGIFVSMIIPDTPNLVLAYFSVLWTFRGPVRKTPSTLPKVDKGTLNTSHSWFWLLKISLKFGSQHNNVILLVTFKRMKLKFRKTDCKLTLVAFLDKAASALDEAFSLKRLPAASCVFSTHQSHS